MSRRKIWLALGTTMLVAAPLVHAKPAQAGARSDSAPVLLAASSQGGEGGERGRASSEDSDLPASLRLLRDLNLLRGHLRVADELVREGRWSAARPHWIHAEELQGGLGRGLKARRVPPFAGTLKALGQAGRSQNRKAYEASLAKFQHDLDAAEAALKAPEANWPALVVEAVLELLRSAAAEYDEAIDGGRIVRPIEYQDARGIALAAETLLETVAEELAAKDADAVQSAKTAFAGLHKAWPSPIPPKTAVMDTSQVISQMSRNELQIGRFR